MASSEEGLPGGATANRLFGPTSRSTEGSPRRRTILVGDVHGCRDELEELLARVGFRASDDQLVFVGDVVVRGPDPHGVLALIAAVGGRVVRGNHEEKLLSGRDRLEALTGEHQRLAATLSAREWQWLEQTPLWIDLPEHGVRVVHAGVIPGQDVASTPRQALLRMRALDPDGGWTDAKWAQPLWGTRYAGPPHVVFGHNALDEPQLHEWATGLDTGCVYGGRLTAMVLGENEPVPRGRQAQSRLTSVAAKKAYAPRKREEGP